ncbi:MAG: thioredoxin family protein [Candidatus Symbiothrix sp.]|jgi:peroxiredoxin|nr:thioredoxin family protein [Candidatus Symbiothrix sp.]
MKKIKLLAPFLFLCSTIVAQTIDFNFPPLAGQNYSIHIYKGTVTDTLQRGSIPADGRFSFAWPEKQAYTGVLHLSIGQSGQNIIVNQENFSVSFNDAGTEIIYSNSPENDYLKKQFKQQQILLSKIDLIYRGQMLYADDPQLSLVFNNEFFRLNKLYSDLQTELKNSKLYASHYLQFIAFINGTGSHVYTLTENDAKLADLQHFFTAEADMDILYSSGLWQHAISTTFNLYPDPKDFGEAMVKNFKRIRSQEVFNALTNDLVTICEQYGWSEAENVIFPYLASSGRLEDPHGKLYLIAALAKLKPGDKAPKIPGKQNLSNSLIAFYESGCSNCQKQLEILKNHYDEIKKQNIHVISLSADQSDEVFQFHSKDFPWTDKRCDYKGFEGDIFKNFGVVATPTFYVTDKKGNIIGRYATIAETGLIKELIQK